MGYSNIPQQLRLLPQRKCPTHIRLKAYLLKCLQTSRQPWIRLRFDIIAERFGVTDRTLRRAKRKLEQDPDLKFRTLSKGRGSGWQVIVGQEAKLLWDKEPLFYKRWREGYRSRNVKDRHCGYLVEINIAKLAIVTPGAAQPATNRASVSETKTLSESRGRTSNATARKSEIKTPSYVVRHQAGLPDTLLYKERRTRGTTAVRTNNRPSRARLLASSGAELRRLATGKQLRLAYFEARSAIAWHIWDNCKVKAQPELLKSLWLAGLLAGYTPKQVEKAFVRALKDSHGLATDIGLLEGNHRLKFEMSHTVAEAKRILSGVEPANEYIKKTSLPVSQRPLYI